ncbi:MAG: hypothetical protein SFY32_00800 [Bacteroidota bacterium]|nr:hypothetical protein [Bacteroidota bacterium]
MKSLAFTSTLSPNTIAFITEYAKTTSRNKNEVIEEAIELLQIELKKKNMTEGFKRMNKDIEMTKLAELGMEEYSNSLKNQ